MKMFSFSKLALALTAAATVAMPAVADAATYISYLEYKNDAPNTKVAPFGKVTLTEIDANTVDVVVTLFSPQIGFLNTGNGANKSPFSFNLTGDYDVTVFNAPGQDFADGGYSVSSGHGTFQNNNFGTYTNEITCCNNANGGSNADLGSLHFRVDNNAPGGTLTFAGAGATFDPQGKLLTLGSGPRFTSTVAWGGPNNNKYPGGFWFSADVITNTGATFNVAARDAFMAVPEPGTWAMMIIGFGGVGAILRRRRGMAFA